MYVIQGLGQGEESLSDRWKMYLGCGTNNFLKTSELSSAISMSLNYFFKDFYLCACMRVNLHEYIAAHACRGLQRSEVGFGVPSN